MRNYQYIQYVSKVNVDSHAPSVTIKASSRREGHIRTHPLTDELIRYRDRELPSSRQAAIEAHLSDCDSCRSDLGLMREALDEVRPESSVPSAPPIWEVICSSIREWETSKGQTDLSAEAVKGRVAREIAGFLGSEATSKVLGIVSDSNHNLLSVVESVLGDFLGRGAAAILVNQVVETAIVKQ